MDTGKDALNARLFQPEHALEQAGKHRTIIGQNRIVPVLKKIGLVDLDLRAEDAAAIDSASHHPVDAAVAVIGAAIAVLAEAREPPTDWPSSIESWVSKWLRVRSSELPAKGMKAISRFAR